MKKAINQMNKLSGRFPEDSENWLIAALDPYHDYQYEVEGLPDERTAPSVVQIHNQSYTLSKPSSAGSGNWDASILFSGFNNCITAASESVISEMITVPKSSVHWFSKGALVANINNFGSLNLWAGAAGTTMSTGSPITSGDTYFQLGSVLKTDRCRLIGVAFEVTNTTAEIYRQGSITTAMLPDNACDSHNINYHAANVNNDTHVQADRGLVQACTLQPLLAVPGSSTWAAAEGVYVVPRMTMVPRDIYSFAYVPGLSAGAGSPSRVPILYGTDGKTATPEPSGLYTDTIDQAVFAPMAPNGFSPIQCWFSGLSNQSTLTVTYRTIVEYFPALTSSLLPLATPSPVFDPKVLACYSAVAARAPYAVPVDQNAAGDYFRKILQVLGTGLNLISPTFGAYAPLAQGASQLALRGAEYLQKKESGPANIQGRKTKERVSKRRGFVVSN